MTRPVDDADVRESYRELPVPEPSVALDAGVRAAVAAELAGESASPAATARGIPFPRWRRVALPLATAATVVVGVALWQWRATHDEALARFATPESIVASAPVAPADKAEAPEPLAEVAPAPASSMSPPAVAQARAPRAGPQRSAKRAEVADEPPAAPPPAQAYGALAADGARDMAAAATASVAAKPAEEMRAYARRAAAAPQASVAQTGVAQPGVAQAGIAGETDAATFTRARQLVAAHRVAAARALMARWRAVHAGADVPEDLRPLLPGAPPQPETPP